MTYFTIRGTSSGYVTAWPTKGHIYFARLDKNGQVLAPGEIMTPGTNGMRTGVVALSANDGATLVAWKNQDVLGWQLYDAAGQPQGSPGSAPSRGTGAAGVAMPDGRFLLFHQTDLHIRSMCTKQYIGIFLNKKSILHFTCRVIGREIQCRKVVPIIFYLGAISKIKSKFFEYFNDAVSRQT